VIPVFHPTEALLTDYATGDLPTAAGLPISAHLDVCPSCRAEIRRVTELCGAMLADEADTELSPGVLDAVMARLDEVERAETPRRRLNPAGLRLPRAVAAIGVNRRRWFGRGAWVAHTQASRAHGWRSFLLRLPARGSLPIHHHEGEELTFVIQGRFTDGSEWFGPGDIALGTGPTPHGLRVSDDAPCICLVASQGRMRWRNPLIGALRPITRI
jgi:putative transcriptional regulator